MGQANSHRGMGVWPSTRNSSGQKATGRRADPVIARLAARRFGVVTRGELLAAGLTLDQIEHRTRDGRLQILHRGVYAVGHRALQPDGWWWAAVLAGGPGGVLSHRACAVLCRLPFFAHDRIEITVPGHRGRLPTLHVHRSRLDPADVTLRRGIPCTTPARLLLDLAEILTPDELDRTMDEAIRLRLYDPVAVDAVVARSPGRRGLKALARARERIHPNSGKTRSELERLALRMLDDHGVPRPDANVWRQGYRVDLLWHGPRVVVELDSYEFHRTPATFRNDHARDNDLLDAGYRVRRFTWPDVCDDPARTATRIAGLVGRAAAGAEELPAAPIARCAAGPPTASIAHAATLGDS
jgi:very-short-patch-repair endonuclease